MAAGVTIKHKRKAGAFSGGELAAGELGVDVTNSDLYFSVDGSGVVQVDVSAIGGGSSFSTSAELAALLSDETGSGAAVFATSPTLETPVLGAASATTINKVTLTEPATGATLTLSNGSTLATSGGHSITLTSTGSTNVTLPTSGTLATQAYVDTAVTGLLEYQGGYDASTNTPDLDVSPSGIEKGDTYTVTAAGNFFSTAVEVGDMLIAEQDSPTLVGHWTIVQNNVINPAVTTNGLDQFAATTSAELAGVISDETGSGALVFGTSPVLTTPQINDTSADHHYIFAVSELTANRTVTLPLLTGNDTFVFASHTQTLSNKTISDAGSTIDGGTL